MGTTIEYTAPYTPQQNGKVERTFPTIFARTRANFNAAKFDLSTRKLLWAEGANCAFQLDDITVTRRRSQGPPYKTFTNQDPTYLHHLRTFGEVGICKNHAFSSSPFNRGVSKHLCNRGKLGVFVGYLPEHPPRTWKF